MGNKENIDRIMAESKERFLTDQRTKIGRALASLMSFRLYQKDEDRNELKRFFHSLKGTASTLLLESLAEIGKEYEDYIEGIKPEDGTDIQALTMLEGLAKAYAQMEKPELNLHSIEDKAAKLPLEKEQKAEGELECSFLSKSILSIGGDADLPGTLNNILGKEGVTIKAVSDPVEAQVILRDSSFDAVLFDIELPGINGLDLLKKIRKEYIDTPVIILTDKNDLSSRVAALDQGVEDYILKPFEGEELFARVGNITKRLNKHRKELYLDNLTGAYNRGFFEESFKTVKSRLAAKGEEFSVALLDLNQFGETNNLYGHTVGDFMLKQFVKQLKTHLLDMEQVCRLDSDKFLVLFPGIGTATVLERLKIIKNAVREKYFYKDKAGPLEISFNGGIATANDQNVLDVLCNLRSALEDSKKVGIGNLTVCRKQEAARKTNGVTKKRVLIIEDEGAIIYLVKQRLEALGYEVHTAADGESGIQKCLQVRPHLILVDLLIPKTDGFEVCRMVRSNHALTGTKLLVLTASNRKDYVARCAQIGVDGYIVKPFSLLDIGNRVKNLIG